MPLIIQDNYLRSMKKSQKPKPKKVTKKKGKQNEQPEDDTEQYDYNYDDILKMCRAAECMAQGDLLNRSIKRKQNWALMPAYGYQ